MQHQTFVGMVAGCILKACTPAAQRAPSALALRLEALQHDMVRSKVPEVKHLLRWSDQVDSQADASDTLLMNGRLAVNHLSESDVMTQHLQQRGELGGAAPSPLLPRRLCLRLLHRPQLRAALLHRLQKS